MDSAGWVAADHGSSSSTFITLAAAATGFVIGRGHDIWVTRDAIVIPSYLRSVHDDLEATKKIFEELNDDDKARIEELRSASDLTLSELQKRYKRYLADYDVQIIQFDDLGWAATWNPFNAAASKAKKDAELLATKVKALRKDVVSSTSGLLREDMLRREREREAEELEIRRERGREPGVEHTEIPLLPLPATATSTPAVRAPMQVYFAARTWNQLPAILARQTLTAAT